MEDWIAGSARSGCSASAFVTPSLSTHVYSESEISVNSMIGLHVHGSVSAAAVSLGYLLEHVLWKLYVYDSLAYQDLRVHVL